MEYKLDDIFFALDYCYPSDKDKVLIIETDNETLKIKFNDDTFLE